MIDIHLTTELTQTECIAELSCFLQYHSLDHRKKYSCERLSVDSVQRAELKALAAGLREIRCPARVIVHLSSKHLTAAIQNDWIKMWKRNGWKNQKGHLVRDWELWKEIYDTVGSKNLTLTGGGCDDNMGDANQKISG